MDLVLCNLCNDIDIPNPTEWLRACPCGWAHLDCIRLMVIQTLVLEGINCPLCHNPYRIMAPSLPIASTLYYIDKRWRKVNKTIANLSLLVVGEIFSITTGLLTLKLIIGTKAVEEAMSGNLMLLFGTCYGLNTAIQIICYTPWEESVLHILRRCSSIPVFGGFLPMWDIDVKDIPLEKDVMTESLLLPVFAKLAGNILFTFQENNVKRFLWGGICILIVKGFLKIYYIQKKYSNLCLLDVHNY